MEAGPVSAREKGSSRIAVQTVSGFDFEGGHLEEHGISPEGKVIDVPLHKHRVSVDFTRIELEYDYAFRRNWDLRFRLPYEIKRRTASIALVEPASAVERAAMEKNRDVHHPTRTLSGLSDLKLLVARRTLHLLREGDGLDIGLGTSLPTGATEEDPFEAGDAGLPHEHVQFGTGTFDPLLELQYTLPLPRSFTFGTFAAGRFPAYANSKTYKGPTEITAGASLLYGVSPRLTLQSVLTAYYQGFAQWDGERDINSGLRTLNGRLGVTLVTKRAIALTLAVREPITQETLDDQGDAFRQGPSLLLQLAHSFHANGRDTADP